MNIYTSCYGNKKLSSDMNLICVSNSVPQWFSLKLRYAKSLYPGWELLNKYKNKQIDKTQYISIYNKILNDLNVDYIINNIKDNGILLCWEYPGQFCHRRLIAAWIEKNSNITVNEL